MSSQNRSRRIRNSGSGSASRSQSRQVGRSNHAPKSKSSSDSQGTYSYLSKLEKEYNPPFVLGAKWNSKDFYKVKIPHPFFEGEKETVQFPVFEQGNNISDRALFYSEVVDLQEQVNFDGENGALLYYTFRRCLKGDALNEWKDIIEIREGDLTPENFSEDIDEFITKHDSRQNEDLLQDQLNYFSKIKKPSNKSPTEFKTQLESLNKKIKLIPGATNEDIHSEERLKSIYFDAMPGPWKKKFREIGKTFRNESLGQMAQYFDILYFNEIDSRHKTLDEASRRQNNSRRNSSNSDSRNRRPEAEDECPVHGRHKWKQCFLNPHGENYRPRSNPTNNENNRRNNRGDAHMNTEQHANFQDNPSRNDEVSNPQSSETTDSNPYADEFHETKIVEEPVPQVCVEVKYENANYRFQTALLDSGGSRSLIARSKIPSHMSPRISKKPYPALGTAGTQTHQESIIFDRICFPNFNMETWITDVEFFVFEDEGHSVYDLIIGRDVLKPLGLELNFAKEEIRWMNDTLPFTPRGKIPLPPDPSAIIEAIEEAYFSTPTKTLKASDYDTKTTGSEIAEQQSHLTKEQQKQLGSVLNEFNEMFNRVLGSYVEEEVDIKLIDPKVKPIHVRPFTVPDKHRELLKKEIDKLVFLGVLEPVNTSAWAFPSFLVPKKDQTARFVSDFRKLNKLIVEEMCPLPIIKEVLTRRKGFSWVTVIDLTSQFYHFKLTKEASLLCTITTPFGLYRYLRLPMGIKISPAFAQAIMQKLLRKFPEVECFIDDVGIFTSGTFVQHLEIIKEVLKILSDSGFSIKPKKCSWAVKQVEYLGHIITTEGVKPQPKKIDAVLRILPPTTPKQLRSFIGMVNYYRDHVRMRSHILAPLTAQTKNKKKIKWTEECQKSFDTIKSKLAQDALLAFPNPNFPFIIEPDASDYQLGSVILQNTTTNYSTEEIQKLFTSTNQVVPKNFNPVAYFSRKLTTSQKNYTVLEKELLSIVETLLEYRSFLLGRKVYAFSDHRNLSFDNLRSQRALRWRLIAEEFNITILYRAGHSNIAADALSRLPLLDTEDPSSVRQAEERFQDAYLFYPVQNYMADAYPLCFSALADGQLQDANLLSIVKSKPETYKKITIGNYDLIHHKTPSNSRPGTGPREYWKIVIPTGLVKMALKFFHRILRHPGSARMYFTMSRHFYFPNMKQVIIDFVKTCDICQRCKISFPGLGKVPPKLADQNPWEEVHTDLIGPWEFKFSTKIVITIKAITTIDPFLGLCEIRRLKNKTSAHVATKFYEMWLCRYPRPLRCIHDNGSEFVSQEFQDTLTFFGIQSVRTTVKNPQANSMVERMHQTTSTILRSMVAEAQSSGRDLILADLEDFVDTSLASVQHAINASVHMTTRETPGALTYNRDMILPVQTIADWECIRHRKQQMIYKNNLRENTKRRGYDWQPGMNILLEETSGPKLQPMYQGPFLITRVHTNGTVTIQRKPRVFQRVNIRRIKPYYHQTTN